jgi:hypothetical protein
MLQNIAAHNIRVPKHKVFQTLTSHNVQRHKTYTITKCKVHIMYALQNVCMFCDAVCYVTFTFWHFYVLHAYVVCIFVK